jgi:hypothetical protein
LLIFTMYNTKQLLRKLQVSLALILAILVAFQESDQSIMPQK